jgi:hypothetical protein
MAGRKGLGRCGRAILPQIRARRAARLRADGGDGGAASPIEVMRQAWGSVLAAVVAVRGGEGSSSPGRRGERARSAPRPQFRGEVWRVETST